MARLVADQPEEAVVPHLPDLRRTRNGRGLRGRLGGLQELELPPGHFIFDQAQDAGNQSSSMCVTQMT
jgi:hypothetical protein